MIADWETGIDPDWAEALTEAGVNLAPVRDFIDGENAAGRGYLPAPGQVMRAFSAPLARVRVLIVGQDPYPTPGDAVGLSFSTARGKPMPRSLRNIAKELRADTGEILATGDLTEWESQGVMLLNRVLTVAPGEAGSHRRRGWEEVTGAAVDILAARGGPLVAILWGKDAQSLSGRLGSVATIASAHPSPLSASRGFFGSRPFSRASAALIAQGAAPVRWGNRADDDADDADEGGGTRG